MYKTPYGISVLMVIGANLTNSSFSANQTFIVETPRLFHTQGSIAIERNVAFPFSFKYAQIN